MVCIGKVCRQVGWMAIAALLTTVYATRGVAQAGSPGSPQSGVVKAAGAPSPHKDPTSKRTHSGKHRAVKPEPVPVVETRPPDPPPPDWPANAKAQPATVGWDGRQLSVAAANSSLRQVLQDISSATGVKVDGAGSDQRIYGSFGPGTARDVLSQILEGSGYNVLMIGDQGQGTPRELVLTAKAGHAGAPQRQPGVSQPNQNGDDEAPEDIEPQEQQPEPVIPQRPVGLPQQQPGQARTPQQILQEMQQRQLQQQQQQQQSQPNQGVQPPND